MQKRILLYIGNKLASKGVTVSTIDTLSVLLEEDYTVYTASSIKIKAFRFLDMLFSVMRYRKEVSLVLIDTYSTQNFYYAVAVGKLCRWLKLPYILILHRGNLPNRLDESQKLSEKLFGSAKTNVAPSLYLMDAFKAKGYDNLTYIPNAIELKNYPFLLRKEFQPKLLWVRSFAEIYNPMLALKIVQTLQKQGVAVSLTMVGPEKDGSLEKCKQLTKQLNLPITFTGKLSKTEWITLSEAHDIFINTTNFDNMPVSVVEAMSLGLPVISTKVGGIPFLITNLKTGILVPPNNQDAFVKEILRLLADPVQGKLMALNARKLSETFDWQQLKVTWHALMS